MVDSRSINRDDTAGEEAKTEDANFERQNMSPSLVAGMFGGRFGQSMPDSSCVSCVMTDRDHHKKALKEEILKCLRQLDTDESNNNPNNATSITVKSEVNATEKFNFDAHEKSQPQIEVARSV